MTHALIITAKPGGGLTYEDHDVVEVLHGNQSPGNSVTPTQSGFCFVYVADKQADDPEVLELTQPWETAGDSPQFLGKRRYQVTLIGSEFETWVPESEAAAAGIEKTWAEVQTLITDKRA